jgi:hypothetical protein
MGKGEPFFTDCEKGYCEKRRKRKPEDPEISDF